MEQVAELYIEHFILASMANITPMSFEAYANSMMIAYGLPPLNIH